MNDNFYDKEPKSEAEEDYDEPVDYHREKNKFFSNEQLVFVAIVAGLMVLVILIGGFVVQKKFAAHTNQVRKLQTRIKQFEIKLIKIEENSKQIFQLEKQIENISPTMDRFDQFETSMLLRLDALTRQLTNLQNKAIAIKQADSAPQTTSKKSDNAKVRQHTVQSGETLYKISRQYGVAVEELRRTNELEAAAVIYPGQTLIIHSGRKENR